MEDPSNRVVLSVVSSWEAQIKVGLGKLELAEPLQTVVEREITANRWEMLPIHLRHTWRLSELPPLHRDPFDRLLIAQALCEDLVLLSHDPLISSYSDVRVFWR